MVKRNKIRFNGLEQILLCPACNSWIKYVNDLYHSQLYRHFTFIILLNLKIRGSKLIDFKSV